MHEWFRYTASDYDERAHAARIKLDLQAIDLPSGSVDVLLTPHVLEHVPDTGKALDEVHRVLAPDGRMYLQVPILQGRTLPPTHPEFHGDDTPVFWRFGPSDLVDTLRHHGFTTKVLCLQDWKSVVDEQSSPWASIHGEFAVADMWRNSRSSDLVVVANTATAYRLGLHEAYQYLVFEAIKHSDHDLGRRTA